jgi:hypothetical protein
VQDGRASTANDAVPVCIVTHQSREGSVRRALETISRAPFMKGPPRLIRIEDV